jgi:hypothetical protein
MARWAPSRSVLDFKRSGLVACFRAELCAVLGRKSKDQTNKTPPV